MPIRKVMETTLLGNNITVTINGEGEFINDAKVILADLEADSGVVHVIDAVLLPPAETGLLSITGEAKELNIFPNPATGYIRLSGINNESNGNLRMVNANGAVMMNRTVNNISASIDIRELTNGFYIMIVETSSGTYTGKLLVR
jgi:hypothetical protein